MSGEMISRLEENTSQWGLCGVVYLFIVIERNQGVVLMV